MIVVAVAKNGFLLLTPEACSPEEAQQDESAAFARSPFPIPSPTAGRPFKTKRRVIAGVDLLRFAITDAFKADPPAGFGGHRRGIEEHCPTRFSIARLVDGFSVKHTYPMSIEAPEGEPFGDSDSKLVKGMILGFVQMIGQERVKTSDVHVFGDLDSTLDFVLGAAQKALNDEQSNE